MQSYEKVFQMFDGSWGINILNVFDTWTAVADAKDLIRLIKCVQSAFAGCTLHDRFGFDISFNTLGV